MLTRAQNERVGVLIELWFSYELKVDRMGQIINGGPSMLDKFRTFRGEMPESSQVKPDAISGKADRLRSCHITDDERKARGLLRKLSAAERNVLCYWPAVRRQHNPTTQKQWTLGDVAAELALSMPQLLQQRDLAAFHLLELDAVQENANIQLV
jgi:hypothetical protein